MELTVNVGRGYVPAERNKTPAMSIGTIPIDALFSPVRKVNYTVPTRASGSRPTTTSSPSRCGPTAA